MSLKVWKNGSMQTINTSLRKPIVFVNGTKYKIDKAYTFVNGTKYEIWGEGGVMVDYITPVSGNVYAIGETWILTNSSNNESLVNISNLSNPQVTQTVAWGAIRQHSIYSSSSSGLVFWASSNTTNYNKIIVNPTTGSMSVTETKTGAGKTLVGFTNDYVVQVEALTQGTTVPYGDRVYFGTEYKYSIGTTSTPLYYVASSGLLGLQDSSSSILLPLAHPNYPSSTAPTGTHRLNYDSQARIGSYLAGKALIDNVIVVEKTSGTYPNPIIYIKFYNTSIQEIGSYTATNSTVKFLGKIDGNYYILDKGTDNVKLVLLNSSFNVLYTKDLPLSPFGISDYWDNCFVCPQKSYSGYIGVSYNSQIVRFSALI